MSTSSAKQFWANACETKDFGLSWLASIRAVIHSGERKGERGRRNDGDSARWPMGGGGDLVTLWCAIIKNEEIQNKTVDLKRIIINEEALNSSRQASGPCGVADLQIQAVPKPPHVPL